MPKAWRHSRESPAKDQGRSRRGGGRKKAEEWSDPNRGSTRGSERTRGIRNGARDASHQAAAARADARTPDTADIAPGCLPGSRSGVSLLIARATMSAAERIHQPPPCDSREAIHAHEGVGAVLDAQRQPQQTAATLGSSRLRRTAAIRFRSAWNARSLCVQSCRHFRFASSSRERFAGSE